MIVITRNGKTTVYKGWQAWLMLAVIMLASWIVLAVFIFAFFGVALTITALFLLLVPAAVLVAAIRAALGWRRS